LENCAERAIEAGRCNYSYIRDTIQNFIEAADDKEEEPEQKMKYKADDSKYSLARLTQMQEERLK